MQARVVTGSDAESPWVLRSSDQVTAFHKGHASQRLLVQFLKTWVSGVGRIPRKIKIPGTNFEHQNLTC